jgi:hypothetical protein
MGTLISYGPITLDGIRFHRAISRVGSPNEADSVRDRVDGFVFLLYQVLWMYPIYCISFILNTIWYQEIADDGTLLQDIRLRVLSGAC